MAKGRSDPSGVGNLVGWLLVALGTVGGLARGRAGPDGDRERHRDGQPGPSDPPPATGMAGRIARVDAFQRRNRPIGFAWGVIKKFTDDGAGRLAALVSYYAFFSIFPLMMALSAILGFVLKGREDWADRIREEAADQIPVIGNTLKEGNLTGSGLALAVGVALSIWAGLAAMDAVTNAMDEVWDVPVYRRRGTVGRRLRGLLMLGVAGLGLVASVALASLVSILPELPGAGVVGLWAAGVAVNVGLVLVSFKVLCDAHTPWSWLWPGALLAGTASYLLQRGAVGVAVINSKSEGAPGAYETFALVLGVLSWLFIVAQVTILCAEINVVRARRLWPRSMVRPLTDADVQALHDYAASETRLEDSRVLVEIG